MWYSSRSCCVHHATALGGCVACTRRGFRARAYTLHMQRQLWKLHHLHLQGRPAANPWCSGIMPAGFGHACAQEWQAVQVSVSTRQTQSTLLALRKDLTCKSMMETLDACGGSGSPRLQAPTYSEARLVTTHQRESRRCSGRGHAH